MFWLKRLHEIQEEAKEANEKSVEEYATDAIETMVNSVSERNSEILRAYQNGGDVLHQDNHLFVLEGTCEDGNAGRRQYCQLNIK
jgi:hypothetical protein